MGCCGKGSSSYLYEVNMVSIPGEEGMIKIRYNGSNYGNVTRRVNGRTYRQSAHRPVMYVDSRDVEYFLTQVYEKGVNPTYSLVEEVEETAVEEVEIINTSILDGTVSELQVYLEVNDDLSLEQLQTLLSYEEDNKNRASAKDAIQNAIDNLD